MPFPTRADREHCWAQRDELWKCLDENSDKVEACTKFREAYIAACPAQWVKHFDRKREYLKFRDRLEKEGYVPPPDSKGSSSK